MSALAAVPPVPEPASIAPLRATMKASTVESAKAAEGPAAPEELASRSSGEDIRAESANASVKASARVVSLPASGLA